MKWGRGARAGCVSAQHPGGLALRLVGLERWTDRCTILVSFSGQGYRDSGALIYCIDLEDGREVLRWMVVNDPRLFFLSCLGDEKDETIGCFFFF